NEKIEGFFDVCRARGLTGTQGVIIPHQNVEDLMLRKDVLEAVAQGKFHVYPIHEIDQGIELLTGVAAGQMADDGTYPEATLHARVDKKLRDLAEGIKAFIEEEKSSSGPEKSPAGGCGG
ncbi:MAG TPA: ATP-dependent protease, partial [Thermodesulfobacteriota bacterium]|nr:ATP-dependent protease [Thermodesulfobacteriota bacterium]